MRPEDFKLNSDYLAIATASRFSSVVTFPGGSIPGSNSIQEHTIDFNAPALDGTISKIQISLDDATWYPGYFYEYDIATNVRARFTVMRINSKIIRAYLIIVNGGDSTVSYPAKTFFFKESSLFAPDMV